MRIFKFSFFAKKVQNFTCQVLNPPLRTNLYAQVFLDLSLLAPSVTLGVFRSRLCLEWCIGTSCNVKPCVSTSAIMQIVGYVQAIVFFPGGGASKWAFPARGLGTQPGGWAPSQGAGHPARGLGTQPGGWAPSQGAGNEEYPFPVRGSEQDKSSKILKSYA